jgi:hypothetical protein
MAQAFGRAGSVSVIAGNNGVEVKGIYEFLRDASKADKRFDVESRVAAGKVAENLLVKARVEAGSVFRNRQALEVMKGMRVGKDRIPKVYLATKSGFVSVSNPNRKRKRKVTRGDVFFGAEFGGGARPRTKQFLRHRGKTAYFFWPTVRKEKENIAREYLDAIQKVLNTLKDSA